MPRIARVVIPSCPHHVTQRGNYGQPIFSDDDDRQQYLRWLIEYKSKYGLLVWAWCLMPNHVHLICVPRQAESLASTLRDTHMRYANYKNRKEGLRGHLWQGRYYSCALGGKHLWAALRYIERNPVRAQIVRRAEQYAWSSARPHVSGKPDGILDDGLPMEEMSDAPTRDWRGWLSQLDDEKERRVLRSGSMTGRPVGSPNFIRKAEALLGHRLHALRRGRPKKNR